jgi:hypothetical protein
MGIPGRHWYHPKSARQGSALFILSVAALLTWFDRPAIAFSLKNEITAGSCTADGRACDVWCNDGAIAGKMYWDGSEWTDGTRFNADQNAEAKAICAAAGDDCK